MALHKKVSSKKSSLRVWLIICFVALVVGILGSIAFGIFVLDAQALIHNPLYWITQALFSFGTLGTFVLAILHLKRYEEKGFAITALVIASLGLVILFMSFLVGLLIGIGN